MVEQQAGRRCTDKDNFACFIGELENDHRCHLVIQEACRACPVGAPVPIRHKTVDDRIRVEILSEHRQPTWKSHWSLSKNSEKMTNNTCTKSATFCSSCCHVGLEHFMTEFKTIGLSWSILGWSLQCQIHLITPQSRLSQMEVAARQKNNFFS